ncbi:MAG: hypothetical protein IJM30_11485 [Thermoguttaceae bacterium]|nr:hypothetical protein [Thermoguttaceae bacterium]
MAPLIKSRRRIIRQTALERAAQEIDERNALRRRAIRQIKDEIRDEVRKEVRNEIRDKVREEVRNEVRDEARSAGRLEILFELVQDGDITIAKAAKRAKMTVPQFQKATAGLALER